METTTQNFGVLIGLPVRIDQGAAPIGWEGAITEDVIICWGVRTQTTNAAVEGDGTISLEVFGWYWLPEDLELA